MEIKEDVGATAFVLPNSQNPRPHFRAYYGYTPVTKPTNSAAKQVNGSAVMEAVNKGK